MEKYILNKKIYTVANGIFSGRKYIRVNEIFGR